MSLTTRPETDVDFFENLYPFTWQVLKIKTLNVGSSSLWNKDHSTHHYQPVYLTLIKNNDIKI